MKTANFVLAVAALGLGLVSSGWAQTIVGFNDGSNGVANVSADATTLETGLDSGVLAFGPGLIKPETGSNQVFVGGDPQDSNWDLATALDDDYYYSVSVAVASGSVADFDSATFETFSQNDSRTFYLFSDLTGFTASDSLGSFVQGANNTGADSHTVTISDAALASVTGSVEFRLYFINQASASTFEDSGFRAISSGSDFVSFAGSVTPVPEPSALAFLGLGGGLLLVLGRRRLRS